METTISPNLALNKIRNDHQRVLELFALFEAESDTELRREIGARAIKALKAHSFIEESLLYPIIRASTGEDELVDDAEEAHAYVDETIAQLEDLPPGARFNAKFHVLAAAVRAHIKTEETELLPALEESGVDLKELGRLMLNAGRATRGPGAGLLLLGAAAAAGLFLLQRRVSKRNSSSL